MSVYTYTGSTIIDEVRFRKTERGGCRAYLHAAEDADANTLQGIAGALRAKGWDCIPFSDQGKPSLEVRGFKKEHQLIETLSSRGWTEGSGHHRADVDHRSFKEKFRHRKLQASGFGYAGGDASLVYWSLVDNIGRVKNHQPTEWGVGTLLEVAASLLYALPTPVLIAFGAKDQSQHEIKQLSCALAKHMRGAGEKLPEDCSLDSMARDHKKGLIQNTGDLLKRYPSEFLNLCYAAAGVCMFAIGARGLLKPLAGKELSEAITHAQAYLSKNGGHVTQEVARTAVEKSHRLISWFNLGVGVSTTSAGIASVVIKEKAHDPGKPHKEGIAGAWEKIQEHPLAIAGYAYMVSTLLHAGATLAAYKSMSPKEKGRAPFRAIFVVGNIVAEILFATASKGHGEGVTTDKSVQNSIIAAAADVIVRKPKALQNVLIDQTSKFLSGPQGLSDKHAKDKLQAQVEALRKNPWARPSEEPAQEPQTELAAGVPATGPAAPGWQARVGKSAAEAPSLSV